MFFIFMYLLFIYDRTLKKKTTKLVSYAFEAHFNLMLSTDRFLTLLAKSLTFSIFRSRTEYALSLFLEVPSGLSGLCGVFSMPFIISRIFVLKMG